MARSICLLQENKTPKSLASELERYRAHKKNSYSRRFIIPAFVSLEAPGRTLPQA